MAQSGSNKVRQLLILLFILVFPSLLYVILSTGRHDIARLPYYGPKEVLPTQEGQKTPDTSFYKVPDARLELWNGTTQNLHDTGKFIRVLHFYCVSCYEESFRVLEQINKVYERFEDKSDVRVVTILIDTAEAEDSMAPVLKAYALNTAKWMLVRDMQPNVETFRERSLLIQEETGSDARSTIVLLDKDNCIRGYFDATQYVETSHLIDAVKSLRFLDFRPLKEKDDNASDPS